MPTRVTPYLGGTGQDNRNKINVHPSSRSVTIGADTLGSANLNVIGNVHASSNVETSNAFISTAATATPTLAFIGPGSGSRWLSLLNTSGYYWYNDTSSNTVPGASSITYLGATFNPKISFSATGDINTAGRFATSLAQIRHDGLASFGTLTIPARNTIAVAGNVYIDGNLFVTGNTFQITNSITAANANTVSANAFVVTKLATGDIPVSNGITFSGSNLVMSAYAYPVMNFSANNNVWISANTTVIGQVAAVMPYNPYQLVDDGLVVMHNGARGNIVQTWIDGRVGTNPRAWGLGITGQGDLSWLVSTAANTKPSVTRISVDPSGNVKIGSGTNSKSNLWVDGNVSVSSNIIAGGNIHAVGRMFTSNLVVGTSPGFVDDDTMASKLFVCAQGAQPVQSLLTLSTGSSSGGRMWGFFVNPGGETGSLGLYLSQNNNSTPDTEMVRFSRTTSNVIYSNVNVVVSGGNIVTNGDIVSPKFSYANVMNEAAVESACIARGWPIPVFGFMALPDTDPPANMVFSRTLDAPRINKYKQLEYVPPNKVRHSYDIDTGEYLGIDVSGTAGKSNPFRWSNNLSVTGQVVLTGVTGTFLDGEIVNDGSNTGTLVSAISGTYAVSNGTGILNGTLYGNTSLATGTISSYSSVWTANNMIVSANAVGLDGNVGTATYLEATAANAEVYQDTSISNGTRPGMVWIRKLAGTGNVYWSYNGTTWLPLGTRKYQNTFVLTEQFTEARITAASGTNPTVRLRLEAAGDKVVVGNMYYTNEGSYAGPIISNTTSATSVSSESMYFNIPEMLNPGKDFTVYMKAYVHNPTVTAYLLGMTNSTVSTNNAVSFLMSSSEINFRVNNNGTNYQTDDSTSRTMANGPQEFSVVGRYRESNSVVMYGNDRLYANNHSSSILASAMKLNRLYIGRRTDASPTQSGNMIIKEVMIWPTALDDATMRLIGNGSKSAIPRPFVENAGEFAPVIQALTKLKFGGTGNVSIECVGDSYATGQSGAADWPKLLATHLDTVYSNSQAACGWVPGGTNLGPARTDLVGISYPSGSWTQTTRTKVSPSLGTSTTSSASAYARYVINRALGTGAGAKVYYVGTADGQAEYSWDSGATRYPLDFTAAGVGNIGTHTLANVITGTGELRLYRLSGTIEIAGVNFTNAASGVVIHRMASSSGNTQDWYNVDRSKWLVGYNDLNPTATIIMLGAYDQSATYNEEAFAFYLQDMINRRRSAVPYRPIMIVMPPDNRRANASPMDFYSKEARRIAALNNCTFVDLQWMFGNSVAEYDLSWWSDTVIPNTNEGGPALVAGILRALESSAT